ncbi:hypothetical protein K4R68_05680 [Staphylococcus epidermidis]|uniref:hypothetical protein n=1 Tax=Staphylococcus epidermidis TaxID=1282 RepID=UPI0018875C5F|nr:hypothetical protein [Staphylococcus epidermidis]MBF2171930.1 hypothetical protein [Staphylococcus epidermidis]MCG1434173.1 hypothetical protein [Staphylococcus epidermidis]MCG1832391.1 hypothetical protein [Staphylococcus epidermidis]MCG2061808.1 hypothetical protein [Staphylococcus epidermidis]MCG2179477.1 hypothetical protein [Staphylococcus epidermidis]
MNYKKILEVLQQNDVREVVKAIVSYETGITDEADFQEAQDEYMILKTVLVPLYTGSL